MPRNLDLKKVKNHHDFSILFVKMGSRYKFVSKEDGRLVKDIYPHPLRNNYIRYTYYNTPRYGICRTDQLHMYFDIVCHTD